jgi:hypothetical protein
MNDFEPPIQNLENIDVLGKMANGGVDMVIVASAPLDGSADTLAKLDRKIRNYLAETESPEFRAEFASAFPGKVRIVVVCEHSVDVAARGLIAALRVDAAARGVVLELAKSVV